MKRLFDLACVILGLVIVWPILVIVSLLIFVIDGWPILFVQERVGRGGEAFYMLKFRTMRNEKGGDITVSGDARITPLGKILRRTKLDELPQLFNVLAGNMSLVGPRPEIPTYVAMYTAAQRQVLDLTPGITDPASLKYIDESSVLAQASDPRQFYIDKVMPDKIRINLEYASRANVISDFRLILQTIFRALA